MTNAVIYARYSSHGQTEQSIEGQLHDAYQYAERNEYSIIGEYIDRALTGTKDARPDFQRMIRDAEKKQFQLVIVWKLDRFARNRYDSAIYKAKLKKYGVRVVSVMENITDSPEGIILEGLLESMAEYYSANLSENVKRGQRESVSKGRFLGSRPPYGYRVQDHHLVAHDHEAPIAKEIFRRYAAGEPLTAIAADLNRRGLRTRTGTAFRASSFDSMVTNSAYVGRLMYAGREVVGCADAIIDQATFDAAQARRQKNKRAPASGKAKTRYLLQGKCYCGMCGAPMIGESGYGRLGAMYHYYTCAARKKAHACKKKNEKRDILERFVCEQTLRYIQDPERSEQIAGGVVIRYNAEFGADQAVDLERRIKKLDADLERLVDDLLVLPASARNRIGARMEQLELQKADLEADLAKLKVASRIRISEDQVRAWISTFRDTCLDDPDQRQRLIDYFINSIYVYDDHITIFFNLTASASVTVPSSEMITALEQADGVSDLAGYGLPSAVKSEPRLVFVHGLIGLVIER